MSRDWLLYLDDLIASAQKVGRIVNGRDCLALHADETAFDALLFNLQIIGESLKQLPTEELQRLPAAHRAGPARLRDLIAHHYFALDPSIIHDVATRHVPDLLQHALTLRQRNDNPDPPPGPSRPSDPPDPGVGAI